MQNQIVVTNIMWDTDGENPEESNLPNEVELDLSAFIDDYGMVDEDKISDYLSDRYGLCHYGFNITLKGEK